MLFSQLFTKTLKEAPADDPSKNARLLTRGGFIYKNSAGVYSYLPLGWRVIEKINKIVREEMNAIGGVEMFMPALVDRKYLARTNRFKLDVGFDVFPKTKGGPRTNPLLRMVRGRQTPLEKAPYALGWTHEEVLTAIASKYISSYKDLPFALYQIQTKFRNEARAKSGLLRGREFLMKDLYSFHADENDLFRYYEKVRQAYFNVFKRCGLKTYYTVAGGGDFTMSNTHEFQVLSDVGEDEIYYCRDCDYSENKEISKLNDGEKCPTKDCVGLVKRGNAIEVGNIFPLGTKYAQAFNLVFSDERGNKKPVVMGSYGIGISRLMGTIVEAHNDNHGIIWPISVAPFYAHIVYLPSRNYNVKLEADTLYNAFKKSNLEVLYDDRDDVSAGEKFSDADLLGMPWRIVLSDKTLAQNSSAELKRRGEKNATLCSLNSSAISQKILA